jgi:hypothetical protein
MFGIRQVRQVYIKNKIVWMQTMEGTCFQRNRLFFVRNFKNGADSVPGNSDVDHMQDLQLGGKEDVSNMRPLDKSVNRSLGKQINNETKDLPYGTKIDDFNISD